MADSKRCIRNFLTMKYKLIVGEKCFDIKFLVFPEFKNYQPTLIESNFLAETEIVIRMDRRSWTFENNLQQMFHFVDKLHFSLNLLEAVKVRRQLPQGT